MEEIWKGIKGYEGLYQVSNLGRVKSLERVSKHTKGYMAHYKEKILASISEKNGYVRTILTKNNTSKSYYIHRLVAEAFIPNPDNLPEVNHIDENKANNCVNNLEWCTHKYNSNYGTRLKKEHISHINHPKLSKRVLCVETGIIYNSAHEANRQTNINLTNICKVCRGERHIAGGYHWEYIDEEV